MAIDIRLKLDPLRRYTVTFANADATSSPWDCENAMLAQRLIDCCPIVSVSADAIVIDTRRGPATIAPRYHTSRSAFSLA